MKSKENLIIILKEQVRIYAEFETLCKSEMEALYGDNLHVLTGVMKNKANLIEKLNKLDLSLKRIQEQDNDQKIVLRNDSELKILVEEAIRKVERVQKLESKTKDTTEKQLSGLEMELLNIRTESEILRKYSERSMANARFVDINR